MPHYYPPISVDRDPVAQEEERLRDILHIILSVMKGKPAEERLIFLSGIPPLILSYEVALFDAEEKEVQ